MNVFTLTATELAALERLPAVAQRYLRAEAESPLHDVNSFAALQTLVNSLLYDGVRLPIINSTGVAMAKGKAVAFQGYDAASGRVKVVLADKTSAYGAAIGVLEDALADGGTTYLRHNFLFELSGLSFAGPPAAGANLYLSTSGDLSATPGTGGDLMQVVGFYVADAGSSDTLRICVQPPVLNTSSTGGLITGRKVFAGGAVTDTVAVSTAYNGKRALVTINSQAAAAYVVSAEVAAGVLTVTFSADPGASSWSYLLDAR